MDNMGMRWELNSPESEHQTAEKVIVLTNEIRQKQIVNHVAKPSHHGKNAQHHHQVLQSENPA